MTLVSKTYTFSVGAKIFASEHNQNLDTLYSDYNGNIANANIKAAAGIVDSKLAQIVTAGKVSGAALTDLASIPAGAGAIPAINAPPTSIKIGSFNINLAFAGGDSAYTGVGFKPTNIIFLGGINGVALYPCLGFANAATNYCAYSNITSSGMSLTASIQIYSAAGKFQEAVVKTLDADGFTLTWAITSTPTGTGTFFYMAFK